MTTWRKESILGKEPCGQRFWERLPHLRKREKASGPGEQAAGSHITQEWDRAGITGFIDHAQALAS